jgi:hypothetical protein
VIRPPSTVTVRANSRPRPGGDDETDVPVDQRDGRAPGPLTERHGPLGHRPAAPREPYDFQTPLPQGLLRRTRCKRKLHFVAAELTLPHLAGPDEPAPGSLAKARDDVMARAAS